jgi:hypothetical protein
LTDGAKAFANRRYVWVDIPGDLPAGHFARTYGNGGEITAVVAEPGQDYIALLLIPEAGEYLAQNGWTATGYTFRYTDADRTLVRVFTKHVAKGTLTLPCLSFTGAIILLP